MSIAEPVSQPPRIADIRPHRDQISSGDPAPHGTPAELEERFKALEAQVAQMQERMPEDRVSIVVFSGDLDRALAAFVIATGAAALGQQVSLFFTFWGLGVLREGPVRLTGKSFPEKLMSVMSPAGPQQLPVSSMNFFGIGARMLKGMMKTKNVASLEELMALARELGVRIVACEMSRDVMGVRDDELATDIELGGVATFLGDALKSRATLFI